MGEHGGQGKQECEHDAMLAPGARVRGCYGPAAMDLTSRNGWIFDMDGTLTVAVHDFEAIRVQLDLPPGQPILEALDALPPGEAAPRRVQLIEIERQLAADAVPAPGAVELVSRLADSGARLGILTRNDKALAHLTLEACGLDGFFDDDDVLGREECAPKPSPEGIVRLLARWQLTAEHGVMVGDFRFDLEAARSAGVASVWVDLERDGAFADLADVVVEELVELLPRLAPPA